MLMLIITVLGEGVVLVITGRRGGGQKVTTLILECENDFDGSFILSVCINNLYHG